MIEPEEVQYKSIATPKILYKEKEFAIASFKFNGAQVYGIRWNGAENEKSKGTPTAYGKPTWFIIPNKLIDSFIKINITGENK